MKNKVLKLFIIWSLSLSALAAVKPVTCETNFGERSFTIEGNAVAFHQDTNGRSISSVLTAKTQVSVQGFNKTIYKNGYKHLIHIQDTKNLNSNNDFLAVTSPKGHKMTYPIHCSELD